MSSKPSLNLLRPLSWSSISSFAYDKEAWYDSYVLGKKAPANKEMSFGKHAADSFITDTPVAPVVRYTVMEQKLEVVLKDIPLIGFMDTYEPEYQWFREYKTGKRTWDQKRVDSHGQITMYALMLYITYKTPPEEMRIHLDWIPTQENGDFTISFAEPRRIVSFETKRTMQDITKFISKIRKTRERMIKYCLSRGAEVIPKELAEPYLH